jgi:LacI family transcriptional regulator
VTARISVKDRRRSGIREVAERAGVAISSVSRVLSGHSDVSPHMRDVVMAAVTDMGYQPDVLARGLRSRKTQSIGYVVSTISNPVLAEIITGAEGRLKTLGYSLLITNSAGQPEYDVPNIRHLLRRRVDGLILSLSREDNAATTQAICELDTPFVLVDRDPPAGMKAWTVSNDHYSGMAAATRHLVDLGHRNVAVIIGGPRLPARLRSAGVEDVLREVRGTQCRVVDGDFSIDHGIAATRRILRDWPACTAIVAGGNLILQGALLALHDQGIVVGAGMSVVGCDDLAISELHDPPIAVVRRDTRRLGMAAADAIMAALQGAEPEAMVLPTEFVARASCAPVRL